MSIDRSLKSANALTRHRNVLNRAERMARLKETETWEDGRSVFGLPKVAHRNLKLGKKSKKKEEGEAGKEGAATPAAAAAPASTSKGKEKEKGKGKTKK